MGERGREKMYSFLTSLPKLLIVNGYNTFFLAVHSQYLEILLQRDCYQFLAGWSENKNDNKKNYLMKEGH